MPGRRAVDLALRLAHTPALAPALRDEPLPPELLEVIRIAARCPEALEAATTRTGLSRQEIRNAATVFLEQVLFFPGAEAYRILGVSPDASRAQMREHMRWLLQWLHPDHNPDERASTLAARVIEAWRTVGRLDHDENRRAHGVRATPVARAPLQRQPPGRLSRRVRWIAVPLAPAKPERRSVRRSGRSVLAIAAALAVIIMPDSIVMPDSVSRLDSQDGGSTTGKVTASNPPDVAGGDHERVSPGSVGPR